MSLTEASCDLKTDVTSRANRVITVVSRETAPAAAAAAPSQELRDSLVDMYSVNPAVNSELQQRLSSGSRSSSSSDRCRLGMATPTQGRVPAHRTKVEPPRGGASGGQVTKTAASCHQDVSRPIRGSEAPPADHTDKKVPMLLKELDTMRATNHRLLDQLVLKETALQRQEVEEELQVEKQEAQSWERPTALLEELLAAQRDREEAVMSRLLLANEDRDEAVRRVRQLQQAFESEQPYLDQSHMNVDELLCCVCAANSAQEVQHFGTALVRSLQVVRERRHDITGEEMEALMAERNAALAKCKQLEQDLIQEREQWPKQEPPRLNRQRGGTLKDRQPQEAEQQVSGTNQSDKMSSACQTPPSLAPPSHLRERQQSLEAELLRCQEAELEANEQVRRLERLVDVLRKKVGTGSLRAVI
ncbi:mirror-image polydactyly gene 1 protein isoform X2 [Nelusetta ayraudi]|uniref:mirror-image polydactyly gene 1 protein isoform X2 n=1 Tax=Nelusetta ayraudi TaxID=303726 RepID=UPI003F6F6669